jgi:hypothetical protein
MGDCFYAAAAKGMGLASEAVRKDSSKVLSDNVYLLKGVIEGRKFGPDELIVDNKHQGLRMRLMNPDITDSALIDIYIALKRVPTTYANIPEDALAVAQAIGVDLFILWRSSPGSVNVQWYNPTTMQEFILYPKSSFMEKILKHRTVGEDIVLPDIMRDVDAMGLDTEVVPAEEKAEEWTNALARGFLLPTAFFSRSKALLLQWNGATGAAGHFTLLSGPKEKSSVSALVSSEAFLKWAHWEPALSHRARPRLFETSHFLKLAISYLKHKGKVLPLNAEQSVDDFYKYKANE